MLRRAKRFGGHCGFLVWQIRQKRRADTSQCVIFAEDVVGAASMIELYLIVAHVGGVDHEARLGVVIAKVDGDGLSGAFREEPIQKNRVKGRVVEAIHGFVGGRRLCDVEP